MLCCVGCVLLALSCVARRSRFRPHASLHPIRPRVRGTSLLLCTLHSHASHCNVRPPAFATVHASPQLTHLWRRPVAALVASPSHASSAWSPLAPWSAPRPPPSPPSSSSTPHPNLPSTPIAAQPPLHALFGERDLTPSSPSGWPLALGGRGRTPPTKAINKSIIYQLHHHQPNPLNWWALQHASKATLACGFSLFPSIPPRRAP